MIEPLRIDRPAVMAWLEDDTDEGGAHWVEALGSGFQVSSDLVYDVVGDARLASPDGRRLPRIYAEAEPDSQPELLVGISEVDTGVWLATEPFRLGDVGAAVGALTGADAFLAIFEWVVGRLNATLDTTRQGES